MSLQIKKFLMVVFFSTLLSGCGAWQMLRDGTVSTARKIFLEEITSLKLDLKARQSLNPDERGRSLSVVVRIYQLNNQKNFQEADYDTFLLKDKTLLAQDLLSLKQYIMLPGQTISIDESLNKETKFIGIVAFYHYPESNGRSWLLQIERKQLSNKKPLSIELIENSIKLEEDELL